MKPRAVITGLGMVSPIGVGVGSFWKAALDGQSGIRAVQPFGEFSLEDYRSRVAGQVVDFHPEQIVDPAESGRDEHQPGKDRQHPEESRLRGQPGDAVVALTA